jgi:citrate lyase subunit beta-like protein
VNYKDLDYLRDECEDGRRLGFSGKQAIHPSQVDTIQSTFVPTSSGMFQCDVALHSELILPRLEISRAAKIVHEMKTAYASQRGAFGLELEGGGKEMIDAPMLKQVSALWFAAYSY